MAATPPYVETEIKLRYRGTPEDARRLIEQRGYRLIEPRTLESDQLFDRAGAELRSADKLLRLRRAGARAFLTFKGPGTRERHKSREEIELEIPDPGTLTSILARLGYSAVFRYEKYRTKLAAPGEPGIVTLDETPMGVFLELEGPAVWIDQAAERLAFTPADYLTSSYASLHREYRRAHEEAPMNMVFGDLGTA